MTDCVLVVDYIHNNTVIWSKSNSNTVLWMIPFPSLLEGLVYAKKRGLTVVEIVTMNPRTPSRWERFTHFLKGYK